MEIRHIRPAEIPAFQQLAVDEAYSWAEDFARLEEIRAKIDEARRRREAAADVAPSREEVEAAIRAHLETDRQRRVNRLAGAIQTAVERRESLDVGRWFSNQVRATVLDLPITEDELTEALGNVEFGPGKAAVEGDVERVEAEIAALESEAAELTPARYIDTEGRDVRAGFVKSWKRFQAACSAPVGPLGFELGRFGGEPEKRAHEVLGIWKAKGAAGYGPRKGPMPRMKGVQ